MTAHPPRTRWHVETYDPLACEWSSGISFTNRQDAVKARTYRDERYPKWKDGTPVQRRIVLETTTFEDMDADVHLARFPKAGFVLPCVGGQDFAAVPAVTPDGRPAIRFSVGSSDTGHAEAVVPLDMLEEVIAGQRDIARQAGATLTPCTPEWLASQPAGACDTVPRVDGRGDVSHYHHAAAEGAGA